MNTKNKSLPAILGGAPSVMTGDRKANRWPIITKKDEVAVLNVIRDGNISTHPVIRKLERDYAEFTDDSASAVRNHVLKCGNFAMRDILGVFPQFNPTKVRGVVTTMLTEELLSREGEKRATRYTVL